MLLRVEIWQSKWLCVRICKDIEEAVKYYQVRRQINNKERIRIIQVIQDSKGYEDYDK